ncbi:MAG: TIGR00266 family protein [Bacteroidetes bacterium]|nr:TIGR00266 family protein [Bacteroidota bacterium]
MRSHELDYKIIGDDIQLVEIELDPNETVIAEAGAMMYMTEGIRFETKMGDGSNPSQGFLGKLMNAGARMLMGESLFLTHFTNGGNGKQQVAFSAPYPGTIIPVDLNTVHGNTLMVQKDAFLCAAMGTKMSIAFNQKLGTGFFGGEGFIMEKLEGDGMAFIHAGGTVIERQLNNETLRVDTGCVVGFEDTIDFGIERAGNLRSMVFGGEGLFLATMRGTGRIWLQSMPISKLVAKLSPSSSTARKEGSSLLGSIFEE